MAVAGGNGVEQRERRLSYRRTHSFDPNAVTRRLPLQASQSWEVQSFKLCLIAGCVQPSLAGADAIENLHYSDNGALNGTYKNIVLQQLGSSHQLTTRDKVGFSYCLAARL